MRAALGLGSNLADRRGALEHAATGLGRLGTVLARSAWIETVPVGGPAGQGPYLNGAVVLQTALPARELLRACLALERELGRDRGPDAVRWGPRVIDIDLLLYEDQIIDDAPELLVPHPRMCERGFVLEPLAMIAGDWLHPSAGRTIGELWQKLRENA